MAKYETMYIVKPTLTQEEIATKVELIKETLTKKGAVIAATDEMGMRNLAYKINKHERGYYVVVYFEADGEAITELERIYGITEDIIRTIVIKYTKTVEIEAWKSMSSKIAKVAKPEEKSEEKPEDTKTEETPKEA
jgi:small subunit ribosomal protein S6